MLFDIHNNYVIGFIVSETEFLDRKITVQVSQQTTSSYVQRKFAYLL